MLEANKFRYFSMFSGIGDIERLRMEERTTTAGYISPTGKCNCRGSLRVLDTSGKRCLTCGGYI